ncbi:uncharacterized protein UTRI_01829_B [Ustilago trichophora]|uniref:Uncharacterized protein n=1 Tax=Ustilago trichophora TaxID=86804 RepID=A0A5C3E5K5_9BASI|nr:uncharacterized protein UTRI_01829_B [Ustilago trichophora]
MSDQRSGEVAAASPPPAVEPAATHTQDQISSANHHVDTASTQPTQSSAATAQDHDEASTSTISASVSERDVEAMTAVQDRTEQQSDPTAAAHSGAHASVPQVAGAPVKKFTSLNVNKRFLEKAGPTTTPVSPAALKLGTSVSPRPSHRLSSPSATSRLTSAKLSSVPKPQPAGWATTKPATPTAKTTPLAQPSPVAAPASTPVVATDAPPAIAATSATSAIAATSADPLPAEASAPLPKAVHSPKPVNSQATQVSNSSAAAPAAGAAASPRLVSMGRDSPRPGSAGLESGSGHGRASPGLRIAALGSSLRAPSPANVSRAPWAGVKSSLSPDPTSTTRNSTLSDFPTAAEAARAKQEQEEKAAAAAAREAARQQAALQALDRFRGTSLGSGKHWDEMEDEDGGFLGEVVEFGDGSQYKIPTTNDGGRGDGDDGPPVSKEDRFKDVSHDRSWPQRNAARPPTAMPNDRARPPPGPPAAWGPMKNREMATSASTEPVQTQGRPSRSEQRAEKVIIPTSGASVSLRSPIESRDPSGYSYGRERRSGPGPTSYGGRQDQVGAPPAAQAASAQAVRAWGPLAQRQASLNPGAAPPATAPAKSAPSAELAAPPTSSTAAPSAPEPTRPVATVPSVQSQQQQQYEQQRAPQPLRDKAPVSAREPPTLAAGPPNTNGRPLPPHLLVAGSADGRPSAQSNRPLPPHLAQNLRPAVPAQSSETVGRKTSHAFEEARRPRAPSAPIAVAPPAAASRNPLNNEQAGSQPQSQSQHAPQATYARQEASARAPWGPKAMAHTRAPTSADASALQSSLPPAPASSQPSSSGKEEDVHASIERARKRREEEERQRLAEKERARQKALAIEERIRAAQQQKEAEAQKAAQRQAAEEAKAAATVAAATVQEVPSTRKPGPADSAASWRTARPQGAATDSRAVGTRQQQVPAISMDVAPTANSAPAEQSRNGRFMPSQRESRTDDERLPLRREQREQRSTQPRDETRQRSANAQDAASRLRLPHVEGAARTEEVTSKADAVEAPKTILTRPVKSPPSQPPTEIRIRGTAPTQAVESRPHKNASLAADRAAAKAATSPRPREAATQEPSRSAALQIQQAAVPVPTPAPVRLYPIVAKEAVETRQEAAHDAPPAWNRFVVHIKTSRPRPRLNRYQQKQLFARIAAMKAPVRPVYPLTWDPPIPYLPIKTLSRDDQLFPKRFHRGTVITPVKLPSRVLPRGLPSIVPHIMSQGAGARKQARFDLTPQWQESQRVVGLGNGASTDAQAPSLSPGAQIQVRLPGHHATLVQPHADAMQATASSAHRRAHQVDPTADAIIGEVLSSGASQSTFDDRSRAFHAGAAPGSLGPLDYPQNGYSTDAFGSHNPAGGFRSKGHRGSNAAVAFYDDRQVSTPSPVSFMVNSEIKAEAGGARGSLSPFAIPGSTRASQAQTPASGGSMLPSPSLSTQGTWGQSSLTFPVLETRSSNLADRDHIKSVWSLTTNSHSGEMQNSLKDIGDDFLPSTMPMSVHDFRADESHLGGAQEEGDRWASSTFNRFQQYGRAQQMHDMNSNSRDLSPVNNRSNGFDPTSRSPSLGMDASAAAAAARARESQQASSAYSSLNGGAYAHHQSSSYSPRERQQDGGSGLSQAAFGAYGGYTSGASNNVSSMTTDALYGMSNYGGGSMTPNRQSYGQYGSHASAAARSAPGSPYSGMSRHTSNLTSSGVSGYSLFPTSGSGASGTRSSQASNGMEGLGVLDDASFGTGRNQFYGARGYQQQQYSGQQSGSGKWPSSSTTASASNSSNSPSVNVASSVLRPAASVFNPSKYSASQQQSRGSQHSQTQSARLGQHSSPQHHHHHGGHHQHQHQQQTATEYSLDQSSSSNGPIDREAGQYNNNSASASATTAGGAGGYGSGGYSGFSSGAGLW